MQWTITASMSSPQFFPCTNEYLTADTDIPYLFALARGFSVGEAEAPETLFCKAVSWNP